MRVIYCCLFGFYYMVNGVHSDNLLLTGTKESSLVDTVPDYSNPISWAALPFKHDPSDSVPAPLRAGYRPDSSVDVFFIHPTTFTDRKAPAWNASLNDALMNLKTDYSTILYQASVYNEYRVFAPRYRQANLKAYYTEDTTESRQAFDLAYSDIKASFQYYLDHYNMGQPIIIASHSQGTTHALRLLKEFFENKPLKNKLVVAYLVGMFIPNNYSNQLSMCKDSLQTGCICGWRTYENDYAPDFVLLEHGTGQVTNPLSWTTTDTYAPNNLNKGSVLRDFNVVLKGVSDAQIHNGILWIHKPDLPSGMAPDTRNYHIADINLFYINIRDNVRQRVAAFWKK